MDKRCKCCDAELKVALYAIINDKLYKSCPGCSVRMEEHVFYECPEGFGTTSLRQTKNNPLGMQSHCKPCRSGKVGPFGNEVTCTDVANVGYLISEVRIVPLSRETNPNLLNPKDYFLHKIPANGGKFPYQKDRMNCAKNSFLLFVLEGKIIAYAIAEGTHSYTEPDSNGNYGYYQLYSETIHYLDTPLSESDFAKIAYGFTGFKKEFTTYPASFLPAIYDLMKNKSDCVDYIRETLDSELPEEAEITEDITEGARKQILVNSYERSPLAKKECLKYYKEKNGGIIKCEICGFQFGKVYGEEFSEKIHVHHIVEVSSIGKEYIIDPVRDLIPICPNCHMIAHSRKPAYLPDEIRELLRKAKK